MPMGFYQPAQIVIDARNHGVEVRPVDVNHSHWDNVLEEKSGDFFAIRLGFRQVSGIRQDDMGLLVAGRLAGYKSITGLCEAGLSIATLERLAGADAFRSVGLDRRQALWEVSALQDRPVALFNGAPSESVLEAQASLPLMTLAEHVAQDYDSTSLSLKAHPLSLMREKLGLLHVLSTREITEIKEGMLVKAAGIVLVRQRPGTAKGVCFITIEDETGVTNLVVFANLFEQYRKEITNSTVLMVEGKLQRESGVTHVVVTRCFDLAKLFKGVKLPEAAEPSLFRAAGEGNPSQPKEISQENFPSARNFK